MSDAPDERCARCGDTFHCGMNDAEPCACTGVTLDAATLAELRQRYSGCLCLRCLRSFSIGRSIAPLDMVDYNCVPK
jgi:hypothetical protein